MQEKEIKDTLDHFRLQPADNNSKTLMKQLSHMSSIQRLPNNKHSIKSLHRRQSNQKKQLMRPPQLLDMNTLLPPGLTRKLSQGKKV